MKHTTCTTIIFILLSLMIPAAGSAQVLQLYAAGSLKAALNETAAAFEKTYQTQVKAKFGPSGVLKDAILSGEKPDIFASANMKHPQELAAKGWGGPVAVFTHNTLCALAQPEVAATSANLLDTMLDAKIRLGTSTPKADPSGDYAWELFAKAEQRQAGSFATLSGKALQLTGGPDSAKPPEGRNPYGWVMAENKADVFLTYCTNAVLAQQEVAALKIIRVPEELAVGAEYGLVIGNHAPVEAWRFGMFILSPEGQAILGRYGFQVSSGTPQSE